MKRPSEEHLISCFMCCGVNPIPEKSPLNGRNGVPAHDDVHYKARLISLTGHVCGRIQKFCFMLPVFIYSYLGVGLEESCAEQARNMRQLQQTE